MFLTENFPPETNAAATRVYERALYWIREGHGVTVLTAAPNFPEGRLFDGYANRWRQIENIDGIRVVRVKTYIAANKGVIWRTLDFISFMITSFIAGLFEKRPDVVCSTSPQFFAAVAADARRMPAAAFHFRTGRSVARVNRGGGCDEKIAASATTGEAGTFSLPAQRRRSGPDLRLQTQPCQPGYRCREN